MIFMFGSGYSVFSYGIGWLGVYDKSYILLRVFDGLVFILIGAQVEYLVSYENQEDTIWQGMLSMAIANAVVLLLSLYLDNKLRQVGENKKQWQELVEIIHN